MNTQIIANFLNELDQNNNKIWFDKNRPRYLEIKEEFSNLAETVISEILSFDNYLFGVNPKDCIYRINRDIRFSKDKSPYKTWLGCVISRQKNDSNSKFYFQINKEGKLLVAGGIRLEFIHSTKDKLLIREKIAENYKILEKVLSDKILISNFEIVRNQPLSRIPRGFETDHPAEKLLKQKEFEVFFEKDVLSLELLSLNKLIVEKYKAMKGLLEFFR